MVKKIIVSGGPCVGKTSLLNEMCHQVNQKVVTIPAVFTVLRDTAFLRGKNSNTTFWQQCREPTFFCEMIFRQILLEQMLAHHQKIVYCDRSLIDILAFAKYYKVKLQGGITFESLIAQMGVNIHGYDRYVIFPQPVSRDLFDVKKANCSYEEAIFIHEFLKDFYEKLGYIVVSLDGVSTKERAQKLLTRHF